MVAISTSLLFCWIYFKLLFSAKPIIKSSISKIGNYQPYSTSNLTYSGLRYYINHIINQLNYNLWISPRKILLKLLLELYLY